MTGIPGITFRPMAATDIPAAMQLKDAEGWNQTEHDWNLFLQTNPELCTVACSGGQVIGTVAGINYHNELSWIGMMIVAKAFRGKGISQHLMNTVINGLQNQGCRDIKLDATAAGMKVYEKLGFVYESTILRMTRGPVEKERPFSQRSQLLSEDDLEALLKLDCRVIDADRSALIHYLARMYPDRKYLSRTNAELSGYALGRPGTRYEQIGPIVAGSDKEALHLFDWASAAFEHSSMVADALGHNQEFVQALIGRGFKVQRELYRMCLGPARGQVNHGQYLIAGPEFG